MKNWESKRSELTTLIAFFKNLVIEFPDNLGYQVSLKRLEDQLRMHVNTLGRK